MAVKNMQTVATCTAEIFGVSATGTECSGSKRTHGELPAQFLSLPWRPLFGLMPMEPDTAAVQAAHRTSRFAEPARLARSASRAVLSTRPSYMRKRITNQVRG
jgi:hypothetical protein